MKNKKVIFAIVLFLLIGLTIFTFASTDEQSFDDTGKEIKETDGTKSNDDETSTDQETTTDDSSNNLTTDTTNTTTNTTRQNTRTATAATDNTQNNEAQKAVEKAESTLTQTDVNSAQTLVGALTDTNVKTELENRLEEVQNTIDVTSLVANLENQVSSATMLSHITDAKEYRSSSNVVDKVNALNNTTVKEGLISRLNAVNSILDDETAPVVTGIDVEYTNQVVTLTITDANTFTATLNGNAYTSGTEITDEGVYTINVIDAAFNESAFTFTIDTTDPTFDGLKSGGHYDEITVNVSDATDVKITVKNMDTNTTEEVVNGTKLTDDATYYITAIDKAGNEKSIFVAIDTTDPTITRDGDGEYVNQNEKLTINDKFLMTVDIDGTVYTRDDFTVGKNNENFTFEKEISDEGTHTITVTDKAGNTVTETFTIDKTDPTLEGLTDGFITNKTISLKANDANFDYIHVKNLTTGKEFNEKREWTGLLDDGVYELQIFDKAGNSSEKITVTKDSTLPVIEIDSNGAVASTNYAYQKITLDVKITEANLSEVYYVWSTDNKLDENTFKNATKVELSELTKNEDGTYTFTVEKANENTGYRLKVKVVDKAGNVQTKKTDRYILDNTIPTAEIEYSTTALTKDDVTVKLVNASEKITITNNDGKDTYTFTDNGEFTFEFKDKAGNIGTAKATVTNIDRILPIVTISGPSAGTNYIYKEVTVTVTITEANLKEIYYVWDKKDNKLDENTFKNATKLDVSELTKVEDGKYTFTTTINNDTAGYRLKVKAIDMAGNEQAEKTNRYIIDNTAPTAEIEYSTTALTKDNVTVKLVNASEKITITNNDGKDTYTFTDNGEFTFEFKDKAGNIGTAKATVTNIDRILPIVTISGPSAGTNYIYKEVTVTVTITEANLKEVYYVWDKKDNKLDENTFKNATKLDVSELTKVEDGKYTFTTTINNDTAGYRLKVKAIDMAGNEKADKTNRYIIDNTAPVFNNAQATMESPVKIDVIETNLDKIVVTNKTTNETYEVENGHELTEEGFYKIIAYDKVGNVSETWNLTIDNNAPEITIENATENNYYKTDVVVNISDLELQQTYLNDVRQGRATTLTITEEGTHTVKAVDRFGRETSITFVIDKTAPAFVGNEPTMESPVKIDVTETNLDKIVVTNKTTNETYEVENGHELTKDGYYKIIAYDKAGNVSETWNLTIDNNAPEITIENATENNYYKTDVVVNINDLELQQTYLNDVRQGRATTLTITEEGTHTVKAVDKFGRETSITFIIDKTAPDLAVDTITNGISTSEDPQIHATDANPFKITVKLNGEQVRYDTANQNTDSTYGSWFGIGYMQDGNYEVTAIDEAGNEKSYTFKLDRLNLVDSKSSSNYLDEANNTIHNFNSFAIKFNRDLTFNPLSTNQSYIIEMEYSTDGVNYTKSSYAVNNWNQTLVKNIDSNEKYGSSDYSTYTISANSPIHWSGTKVGNRWTDVYNAILATKDTDNKVYVRTLFTVIQPTYTKTFTLDEVVYSKGGSEVSKLGLSEF